MTCLTPRRSACISRTTHQRWKERYFFSPSTPVSAVLLNTSSLSLSLSFPLTLLLFFCIFLSLPPPPPHSLSLTHTHHCLLSVSLWKFLWAIMYKFLFIHSLSPSLSFLVLKFSLFSPPTDPSLFLSQWCISGVCLA